MESELQNLKNSNYEKKEEIPLLNDKSPSLLQDKECNRYLKTRTTESILKIRNSNFNSINYWNELDHKNFSWNDFNSLNLLSIFFNIAKKSKINKLISKKEENLILEQNEIENYCYFLTKNYYRFFYSGIKAKEKLIEEGNSLCIDNKYEYLACAAENKVLYFFFKGNLVGSKSLRSKIYSMNFSHDGKYLFTATSDGTIYIWIIFNSKLTSDKSIVLESNNPITVINSSKDNKYLALGDNKGKIRLFNLTNETDVLDSFEIHNTTVKMIKFINRDTKLITGAIDNSIYILDLPSLTIHKKFIDYKILINLVMSPNNQYFATAQKKQISLWDTDTGVLKKTFEIPKEEKEDNNVINCICISNSNEFLASGCKNGVVFIWKIETNSIMFRIPIESQNIPIKDICFLNENQIACLCKSNIFFNQLFIIDDPKLNLKEKDSIEMNANLEIIEKLGNNYDLLAFNKERNYLACGTQKNFVLVWSLDNNDLIKKIKKNGTDIKRINFNSNATQLYFAYIDGNIEIHSMEKEAISIINESSTYQNVVCCFNSLIPNEIAFTNSNFEIILFDTIQNSQKKKLNTKHIENIKHLAFGNIDANLLISATDKKVKIFNTQNCIEKNYLIEQDGNLNYFFFF